MRKTQRNLHTYLIKLSPDPADHFFAKGQGGLCAARYSDGPGCGIFHAKSSKRVMSCIGGMWDAYKLIDALLPLADWEKDLGELDLEQIAERIKATVEFHGWVAA